MIKLSSIAHLATEVLSIASAHGFSALGLKKVTDLLAAHAADVNANADVVVTPKKAGKKPAAQKAQAPAAESPNSPTV